VGCHAGHSMIPVPASLDAAKWTNLAPGARIDVSSTRDAATNATLIDRRARKGTNTLSWSAATDQTTGQWVTLLFPVPAQVKAVRLYNPTPGGPARSTLVVQSATVRLFAPDESSDTAATSPDSPTSPSANAAAPTTAPGRPAPQSTRIALAT